MARQFLSLVADTDQSAVANAVPIPIFSCVGKRVISISTKFSRAKGTAGGPGIRGVFIFNGGLFTDGHSHPWYTTPMLRRLPNRARRGLDRPFALFKRVTGVRKMWSKGYQVTDTEILELHSAMDRHDGLLNLAAGAGFVADHRAQGDRIDFGHLFKEYRYQFSFLVGGSNEDPFEHRQVDFAQERLGNLGLQIERLPGGHLTTNEQPEALAALIAKLERGLVRKTRASRRRTGYGKNTKARCRRRSPARTEATAQTLTWQFVRKAYTGWPLSLAAHPNLVVHGTANLSLQADISVTFPV